MLELSVHIRKKLFLQSFNKFLNSTPEVSRKFKTTPSPSDEVFVFQFVKFILRPSTLIKLSLVAFRVIPSQIKPFGNNEPINIFSFSYFAVAYSNQNRIITILRKKFDFAFTTNPDSGTGKFP